LTPNPVFRSSLFALLESYAPQLLAGPEAHIALKPTLGMPRAGMVPIFGVLGSASDWFSDTSYERIRADVRRALADPQARTIDLVIDSPGGSVLGLPETADVISQANKTKPVVAHVTGIAASAAYWLASQASVITLTPSGEVGSVGVIDLSVDISKALESAGVKVTTVTAGPFKGERAPFVPLSDDAKAHMQESVNRWYGDFLSAIRRGRGARVSPTSNYGGGRMLSAKDALSQGLVDFIGGAL
jgi:signal peptide peptidase SppA